MAEAAVDAAREEMVQAARFLAETGVLSHSGHGNMSVRVPGADNRILLTSVSRISNLQPAQIALVDFAGAVLEGSMDPVSAEIVPMHTVVYEHKPSVQAVIHTHSPRSSSFALAHRPLPCRYEALLRFGVAEDVPVAPWGPRGSEESVRYIAEAIQAHPTVMAVLLANHGLLAFGANPLAVAYLIIAMEEAAEMTLDAQTLGPGAQPLPEGALERERAHMRQFDSK